MKKFMKKFVMICLAFMCLAITPIGAYSVVGDVYIPPNPSPNDMGMVGLFAHYNDYNTVTLYCTDTKNVGDIKVYRSTNEYGRYYYVGKPDVYGRFKMTGLVPYKSYYFKIIATKWDESEVAVRDVYVQTVIGDVTFARQKGKKLEWHPSDGAQGYNIYRQIDYPEPSRYRKIGTTKDTKYTLKSKEDSFYVVRPYRKVNGVYYYGGYTRVEKME